MFSIMEIDEDDEDAAIADRVARLVAETLSAAQMPMTEIAKRMQINVSTLLLDYGVELSRGARSARGLEALVDLWKRRRSDIVALFAFGVISGEWGAAGGPGWYAINQA